MACKKKICQSALRGRRCLQHPRSASAASRRHLASEARELRPGQVLCQDVGRVVSGVDVGDADLVQLHQVPQMVITYVNMLGATVIFGILSHSNGRLVVSVNNRPW